jgi:hypothetical protein
MSEINKTKFEQHYIVVAHMEGYEFDTKIVKAETDEQAGEAFINHINALCDGREAYLDLVVPLIEAVPSESAENLYVVVAHIEGDEPTARVVSELTEALAVNAVIKELEQWAEGDDIYCDAAFLLESGMVNALNAI